MPLDPTFTAFVVAILTALPAVLLGLAALVAAIRSQSQIQHLEKVVNGQQAELFRRLVAEAFQEGRRAGFAEHKALTEPPPEKPPQL